jgi:hypothetical protein
MCGTDHGVECFTRAIGVIHEVACESGSVAVSFVSRGEFRFDGPRNREHTGPTDHLSRAGKPATAWSAGFLIFSEEFEQHQAAGVSAAEHEEYGESHRLVDPYARP